MTREKLIIWRADRERQSKQHPKSTVRSRGEHYRRKNNGIAYRTSLSIRFDHRFDHLFTGSPS